MRAWAECSRLAQREDALARGIPLIEWSFDPFEAKNAYFNLERLGAIVRNYVPNMYGIRESLLDGDLPTDRCIAEWWISETQAETSSYRARCFALAKNSGSASGAGSRVAAAFCRWTGRHWLRAVRGYRHLFVIAMAIQIERITLREIAMPLVHFFETSFGRTTHRRIILVEVISQGVSGWGEVTCGENPFYNEEWTDAAWMIVRNYVAPRVLKFSFDSAADVADRSAHIRGHYMARGGVEAAVWDLEARLKGVPLWEHIGGGWFKEIACGVSIGIQNTVWDLLKAIQRKSTPVTSASRSRSSRAGTWTWSERFARRFPRSV